MNDSILYKRGSTDPAGRLCVMNVIDRRWKLLHGVACTEVTDHPACTDRLVTRTAQVVNDRLAGAYGRLPADVSAALLARGRRLMGAVPLSTRGKVRLAWMLASKVATTSEAVAALALVKRWLDGEPVTIAELRAASTYAAYAASAGYAASAASAASASAYAAYAASAGYAASAAASAASAASAAAAAVQGDLIDWLDYVLDCHEKVAAEEGQWDEVAARALEIADLLGDETGDGGGG